MAVDLHARLCDPGTYQRQIERLHAKWQSSLKLHSLDQDGISPSTLIIDASKVAKLLAKTVGSGEYSVGPATLRLICVHGKERAVFAHCLLDTVVGGAVADIVQDATSDLLSSRLYSYRKGVSWLTPAQDLAAYIRTHRRKHPNPRERGIYVLRRDIDAYTDNIPVAPPSHLWQILRDALAPEGSRLSILPRDWDVITNVVRPEIREADGTASCRLRGVPTGQPIAPVLYNLYLTELDRELEQIAGAFYARYSDDILFAHPHPEVVKDADLLLERVLSRLELRVKPAKSQNIYLTAAGCPSSDWREARGTSSIPYVGTCVSGDGTVSLHPRKMRAMLRDITRRAFRTARVLLDGDHERVGRMVCEAINRALDPDATPFQLRSASLVRSVVTNRAQLEQLDYLIARIVVRAVTGRAGVRAFRELSYREIRQEWGLTSLFHSRNRGGAVVQ